MYKYLKESQELFELVAFALGVSPARTTALALPYLNYTGVALLDLMQLYRCYSGVKGKRIRAPGFRRTGDRTWLVFLHKYLPPGGCKMHLFTDSDKESSHTNMQLGDATKTVTKARIKAQVSFLFLFGQTVQFHLKPFFILD